MSESATTQSEQGDATPPQAARRRERAPKSADAKERGYAARQLARQLEAVKATKDAEKMRKAAAAMAELTGTEDRPEAAQREVVPESAAPKGPPTQELSAAAPHVDTTKQGWPAESALADAATTVKEVVDVAAVLLAGTKFDILGTISVRVGDKVVERTKADVLAEKLTPLAAKYGMTFADTPEAVAVVGLLTVFGQPLAQLAMEKLNAARGVGA